MEPIIRTVDANRVFRNGNVTTHALKNINMEFLPGRLTVLRGRSGSGKTCMINLLGALDLPSSGKILFEGRDLAKISESQRDSVRRTRFGFVFQSIALIGMMSAYENVEFSLRIAGYPRDKRAEAAKNALRAVGLEKRMLHRPQELSGGEQQRVAIARAIAHNPGVIFADEPTAELDSRMGLQVVNVFRDIVAEHGSTVVMTTHDPNMMELADDVYTISNGEVVEHLHVTPLPRADGSSQEVSPQ